MSGPATKVCALPGCGGVIVRQKGWSQSKWDIRAYCNKSCSARDAKLRHPAPTDTKRCAAPGCAGTLRRRRDDSDERWQQRAGCSPSCGATIRHRKEDRLPTPTPPAAPHTPSTAAQRPVWRPPGWTATPNIRGHAS